MPPSAQVARTVHVAAPDGHAVHAVGQCYTAARGARLIESVVHHAFDGNYYHTAALYRRVSNDNGRSWTRQEPVFSCRPGAAEAVERSAPRHGLDARRGVLIGVHSEWRIRPSEPQFSSGTTAGSYRIYYETSLDEGRTWSPARPVVHGGAGYDEVRWLPGVVHGRNGAYAESSPILTLDDGAIVLGIVIAPVDDAGRLYVPHGGYWYEVAFLQGRWNAAGTALDWTLGERIRVTPEESQVGCCEPDCVALGGRRILTTLRCQGIFGRGVPSARRVCVSEDGGLTWTRPQVLCYDDGEPVHVPASFSAFLTSPRTGRIYWFANILDRPVPAQYPRCPLCMAELDPDRPCIVGDSVRVVQGLPEGAPPCRSDRPTCDEECGRQYTNFGAYVDRPSGRFVIVVPEMPRTTWKEFTSDCLRLEVEEPGW